MTNFVSLLIEMRETPTNKTILGKIHQVYILFISSRKRQVDPKGSIQALTMTDIKVVGTTFRRQYSAELIDRGALLFVLKVSVKFIISVDYFKRLTSNFWVRVQNDKVLSPFAKSMYWPRN